MRRFLVTNSEKFDGTAEIVYNGNGMLCKVDLQNCLFSPVMLSAFIRAVPVQISQLDTSFSSGTTVVEAEYEISFDMFWEAYDKKINRKRAEILWAKLAKPQKVKAFFGVSAYNKYLKAEGWRKKADPEKYLRDQYWENEYN